MNFLSSTHVLRCATEPSQPQQGDLIGELKRFWDLETLGIARRVSSLLDRLREEPGSSSRI